MATKAELISDIILRVTKGKPSDDLELEPRQVEFWIDSVINELLADYIKDRTSKNKSIDEGLLKKETSKPILEEQLNYINPDITELYILSEDPILETDSGSAIVRVITSDGMHVHKTKVQDIDTVEHMEFSKSSEQNLLYYRDGDCKIIIRGIPEEMVGIIELAIWYVPKQDLSCMNDSESVRLPLELIPELSDRVAELALRQMYGTIDDVENNGDQDLPMINR